ncbi:Phosphotransferase family protein [Novosphingobium lubricantis]|jgi:aminoglycoside phosphotransferase (APT) family kinase protein
MSVGHSPDDAVMQAALARRLAEGGGAVTISGWQRAFGGNARRAYAFDACWPDGTVRPCILLSQVSGKHVESDTAAEYAVLSALNGSGVRSPAALLLDAEGAITGAPAIVLERMVGQASVTDFLAADAHRGRAISADLAVATAQLHCFDHGAAGLGGAPDDPVAFQIAYWEQSFRKHRLEPHPVLSWLFGWLRRHAPVPVRQSLVHGDLRPGNFLYEGDRVTALLDWEMAHVGDPAEDVAWIYRQMWSPQRFLPLDDFLAIHAQHAGFAIPRQSVVFYRIFSEAKFAAISLAAAHLFANGKTLNLRHIDRAAKVPACLKLAMAWIAAENWELRNAAV